MSLGYAVVGGLYQLDLNYCYYWVTAASLPFATGALIYHHQAWCGRLYWLRGSAAPVAAITIVVFNYTAAHRAGAINGWGYTANYVLQTVTVLTLVDRRSLPCLTREWDDWLGDLSYPIYLTHWLCGMLLIAGGWPAPWSGQAFFLAALLPLFFVSWLLAVGAERPLEALRRRVRSAARSARVLAPD